MIEQDAIKLLRQCDAGVKMGIDSIEDVIDYVSNPKLRSYLNQSKDEHNKLHKKIQQLLDEYNDEGKDPSPMAKGMSWIKTNLKLTLNESDETIADLMTDGCDMGVKSLNKYLNEYQAADERSKTIAKDLIRIEDYLGKHIREFL